MVSLKETPYYKEVAKEISYSFADIFIFKGFVISEIKEGVHFSWDDHASRIVKDVTAFTGGNGSDLIYISHRINSYSVTAMDWVKFFKHSFNLKGYGIVSYNKVTALNVVIENMFFNKKIKRFNNLEAGIDWAKSFELIKK